MGQAPHLKQPEPHIGGDTQNEVHMDTTKIALVTSVDESVAKLEAAAAKIAAQLAKLNAKRDAEIEAQRKERFAKMLGGPSQIETALKIDWDALATLGIVGFTLRITDGVKHLTPVTNTARASTPGEQRDLAATFSQHATADEKRQLAAIMAGNDAGKKNNASYQLKERVWKRVNGK